MYLTLHDSGSTWVTCVLHGAWRVSCSMTVCVCVPLICPGAASCPINRRCRQEYVLLVCCVGRVILLWLWYYSQCYVAGVVVGFDCVCVICLSSLVLMDCVFL